MPRFSELVKNDSPTLIDENRPLHDQVGSINDTTIGAWNKIEELKRQLSRVTRWVNQDVSTTGSPTFINLRLTGLTENSILFIGAGNWVSEDTNFVYDHTNDRVGIGIAVPTTNVHIYESEASTTPQLLIQQANATGDAAMRWLTQDTTTFSAGIDITDSNFKINSGATVGASDHFVMHSNGHIVIGDATDRGLLSLYRGNLAIEGQTTTSNDGIVFHSTGTEFAKIYGERNPNTWDLVFTGNSGNELLRFDWNTGEAYFTNNVGIGIQNPLQDLHIHSSTSSVIALTNTASGSGAGSGFYFSYGSDLKAYMWNYENEGIYYGTNNTLSMTIDSAGLVTVERNDIQIDSDTYGAVLGSGQNARFYFDGTRTKLEYLVDEGSVDSFWVQPHANNDGEIRVLGGSNSMDAILRLNADDGAASADNWSLTSDATNNRLTFANSNGPTTAAYFASDGGVYLPNIPSGATQALAGAGADELWKTNSHATLPDNVVMIGV